MYKKLLPKINRFYLGMMFIILFLAGAIVITGFIKFSSSPSTNTPQLKAQVDKSYGKLPLSFEKNDGQTDSQVDFLARGNGYGFFLTAQGAVLSFHQPKTKEINVLHLNLVGANESDPEGVDQLPGKSNYFAGNDENKWKQNVSHFAKVKYNKIYPGIDLVYYGNQKQIEYDFLVAAGADPKKVNINLEGAKNITVNDKGELTIKIGKGEMKFHKPLSYQEKNGNRKEIASSYAVKDNRISFAIGNYDKTQTLIIDPILEYSTYLGGSQIDAATAIATDSQGNVIVSGFTTSPDFPTASAYKQSYSGDEDVFVTKLNASGSAIIYSTYLGGNSADEVDGMAIDANDNVYLTGTTYSTDYPVANAYQPSHGGDSADVFLTKLNPNGSALLYSTYLGGNGNDNGGGVSVDSNNNAYVSGETFSTNFPTMNPYQATKNGESDVFVTKFNSAGSALVYSTYLGGNSQDRSYSNAIDPAGNVYVAGDTFSTDFPLEAAFQSTNTGNGNFFSASAFVTKLNATGSALVYSTYLGGTGSDGARDIAVDNSGFAFITGYTGSSDFPTSANAFQTTFQGGDAYVTRLSPSGSLIYSTYLGGSGGEIANEIIVDHLGNAYIAGTTSSTDFPILDAVQTNKGGAQDAFVTKLNATGRNLIYSTYLGGGSDDYGEAIARAAGGKVYLAGFTHSSDFPTASALQSDKSSDQSEAFVAKIVEPAPTHNAPTTTATIESKLSNGEYADPAYITLTATAAAGFTANTAFDLDGNGTQSYVGPFTVSVAGPHTLTYWSSDDSDIEEETHKTLTFTISSTVTAVPVSAAHNSVILDENNTTISFNNITAAGYVTFSSSATNPGGPIPPQYNILDTFFTIATTASYSGPVTITFNYPGNDPSQNIRLLHYDGTAWQDITQSSTFISPNTTKIVGSSPSLSPFAIVAEKQPPKLTSLSPAKVWVGLSSVLGAGAKFDVKAEAYKDTTLVSSGQINGVNPGLLSLGGFASAKFQTIPFGTFTPINFPQGSKLNVKIFARTACSGSLSPLGSARLWYNDSQANSQFGATIGGNAKTYYLLTNSVLGTTVGVGPKKTADVLGGAACSAFKSFGTWSIIP